MPRAVLGKVTRPGISTYTLSPHEEFEIRAVTFSIVPLAGAGGDNFAWLDYRDPNDHIIYLQPLSPADGSDMFYSLAVDASEFLAENPPNTFWPQATDGTGPFYVSQRLSPQILYANCTVNAYKTIGSESPPTDPITAVSPHYSIPDLHLWVEDTGAARAAASRELVTVGPYMLVGGPNA